MNLRRQLTSRLPAGRLAVPAGDVTAAQPLAMTRIDGHHIHTAQTITAWHVIPETAWPYRPDPDRQAELEAAAEQYAALAVAHPAVRLHMRRTTRRWPVERWAANNRLTSGRHDPGAVAALARHDAHIGVTYLGVAIPAAGSSEALRERGKAALKMTDRRPGADRSGELLTKLSAIIAGPGLNARPATAGDIGWLLYRSVGLGLPVGDLRLLPLDSGDAPTAIVDAVDVYRHHRYGTVLRLVDRHTGAERHTTILTLGRMEPITVPEQHLPWAYVAAQLPFPVEYSHRATLGWPSKALLLKLRQIRNQQRDYADHGFDSPPQLSRLADRALAVGDEVETGRPADAVRAEGWVRFAVSGQSVEEAVDRAAALADLYRAELRANLVVPRDQPALYREFCPGEPVADTGYIRHMPVRLLAAGVPHATEAVGDPSGDWIGTVGANRRPVTVDLHAAMEYHDRSGLSVLVAEPGGGKSTLLGALTYLAARRGVQVTVLDPSGPLARLAALPGVNGAVIRLADAAPGTLNPYTLIPDPHRGDGAAVEYARAERRQCVADIAAALLPPQVAADAGIAAALASAVRSVPAEVTSTLDDVIDALVAAGEAGDVPSKTAAALLEDRSVLPSASLFFGTAPAHVVADADLLVITLDGLPLPDPRTDRMYWSVREQLAMPVLYAAHRLTARRAYSGDPHRRKLVAIDEAHLLDGWPAGRDFVRRMSRDSRKWNLAVLLASQNPADILGIDVQNLVSTVWVGRVADDPATADEALRLLGLPAGAGFETTVAGLSAGAGSDGGFRDFLHRDVTGRVGRVRVDISRHPELLNALNTTPGGTR